MKNLSLALNIILLVAVIFLYVKVYSTKSDTPIVVNGKSKDATIVFINSDSLLDHYDFYLSMKSSFEKKRDSIDAVLQNKDKSLKAEAAQYQQKAETMTDAERQQTEEGLMQKQQSLVAMRDNLLDYLNKEEEKMNDSIHNHLVGFLKEYNKAYGYHYILGVQKGSGVLLANDSFDITHDVIMGINKK